MFIRMQMTNIRRSLLSLFSIAPILYACGKKNDTNPVVSIQKIAPSGETALISGETIRFEVNARVQGLVTAAKLGLVIQASDGTILGGCDPVDVSDGASATLVAVVVVPATASVQVFVPLYQADATKSDVLDMRNYKVVGARSG